MGGIIWSSGCCNVIRLGQFEWIVKFVEFRDASVESLTRMTSLPPPEMRVVSFGKQLNLKFIRSDTRNSVNAREI